MKAGLCATNVVLSSVPFHDQNLKPDGYPKICSLARSQLHVVRIVERFGVFPVFQQLRRSFVPNAVKV